MIEVSYTKNVLKWENILVSCDIKTHKLEPNK